jgi:hypothetical protein
VPRRQRVPRRRLPRLRREWRFEDRGPDRTHAELDLRIDPGRFVPAIVRDAISDAVVRRALSDLKAYVER